jgi:hypothetical protein
MINKLVLFGLEDSCKRLKGDGLSYAAIARALSKECGKRIYAVNVSRYFKAEQDALRDAISASTELQNMKAETHLNVIQQLTDINRDTRDILKAAKAARNPKMALLAIQRVEKQLELQAKLLGDIDDSPKVVAIKEIYINEQTRRD